MLHFQNHIEASLFHKLTFLETSPLINDLTVLENIVFCMKDNIYLGRKTKSAHWKNVFGICDRAKHCIHFTDAWYLCQWRKPFFFFYQHILFSDSLRKYNLIWLSTAVYSSTVQKLKCSKWFWSWSWKRKTGSVCVYVWVVCV